jgi:inorganic pyrophosphatase
MTSNQDSANQPEIFFLEYEFWKYLDTLIESNSFVIDRPKGSAHPRFPETIYPLDYGYLQGTRSTDGGEVDLWSGSENSRRIQGILATVDLQKLDLEVKLVVGCTEVELEAVLRFHNSGGMRAIYIPRTPQGEVE